LPFYISAYTTLNELLAAFSVRPKTIVFGKTYVWLWFFLFIYFFSPRNLRAPSADRREILHDARRCVQFYNPGPKLKKLQWGLWGKLSNSLNGHNFGCV